MTQEYRKKTYDIIRTGQTIPNQPPEDDDGNREYKYKLIFKSEKECRYKIDKLAIQMQYRLCEGNGKALFIIGVKDKGHAIGIDKVSLLMTLVMIEEAIKKVKQTTITKINIYQGEEGNIATIRLKNPLLVNFW